MPRVRPIEKPTREGTNVTLSDARAAFRELQGEAPNAFTIAGIGKLVLATRARIGRSRTTAEAVKTPANKSVKVRMSKSAKAAILGRK